MHQHKRSNRQEFKATTGNHLEGYAIVFDSPTELVENGRRFVEVVKPQKLKLAKDVILTLNHDPKTLLARTSSGTLQLTQDERGLKFAVDLPDTTAGRDAKVLIERGDLYGASFTFSINKEVWTKDFKQRDLTSINVIEVAVVSHPQYTDTSLELRSTNLWQEKLKLLRAQLDNVIDSKEQTGAK